MKGIIMQRQRRMHDYDSIHPHRFVVSVTDNGIKKSVTLDIMASSLIEAKAKAIKRASLGKLHGHPRESMEIENILFI
jgi:hypothetical protein